MLGAGHEDRDRLRRVDDTLAEELWRIRRSPNAVGAFIHRHGEPLIRERLDERITPTRAELKSVRQQLSAAAPAIAPLIAGLEGSFPALAWHAAKSYAQG
jgi:hypothetical protein